MTSQRASRAALLATFFTLVAGPAAAQNGHSFLDAARSAIDYRVAPAAPNEAASFVCR